MKQVAWSVTALALVALAAHPEDAPPPSGPPRPDTSSWWSFGDDFFLRSMGVESGGGLFRLGLWRSFVDLGLNGNLQATIGPGYDKEYYSYLTEEGITVRNQGFYVIDPRLLTGDASVRFAFTQARQDASGVDFAQDADITDYFITTTLLADKPYSATLSSARAQYVSSQTGGGTTRTEAGNSHATIHWRESSILREKEIAPYFSAQFLAGSEDLRQITTNAGRQFRRDEQRDRLQFEARNGFETADLSVNLKQLDLENHEYEQGSYRSRDADLAYSVDFGKNLTRHADTNLRYNDRTGSFDSTSLEFDQRLFVEHTAYLSSSLYYFFQDYKTDATSTRAHRADAGVGYMPFLNVSTNADVFGSRIGIDGGTIDTAGGSLGATYSHWLPASGTLTTSLSGGLQFADTQLESALVPVIGEGYQAPPELGAGAGFRLNQSNVLGETIVVFDVRDGARLPTTEGVDYEVVVEGSRTEIRPLVSSPVIQPNDPLEVSYSYLVDPGLKSRSDSASIFISADWSWISVALQHDVTRQVPLSGPQDTLLADQDRTTLRIDMRGERGSWQARGGATARRYRDERLKYDEVRLGESLWWRPGYRVQVGFDANQSYSRYLESGRQSRYFDNRLSATLHSRRGWWTDAYVSYRAMYDSDLPTEKITEGYLRVRRNWPQLSLTFAWGLGSRKRGPVSTDFHNLQFNLTRTF